MANTVTLPRADWNIIIMALNKLMADYTLIGGSLDLVLQNIEAQLDNQEY